MTANASLRPSRWWALSLAAATSALVGCIPTNACPAVGYVNPLTVRLGPGWENVQALSIEVTCPPAEDCGLIGSFPRAPGATSAPGTKTVDFSMRTPKSVVVTVRRKGTEAPVLQRTVQVTWTGGNQDDRCGSPAEATVVLPPA